MKWVTQPIETPPAALVKNGKELEFQSGARLWRGPQGTYLWYELDGQPKFTPAGGFKSRDALAAEINERGPWRISAGLPCITLHRPWSSFVALGMKTIETRTHKRFACLAGRWIGIHAANKWDNVCYPQAGAGMAAPYLRPAFTEDEVSRAIAHARHTEGAIVAIAHVAEQRELTDADSQASLILCGPPARKRWGLVLDKISPLPTPLPRVRGLQGVWFSDNAAVLAASRSEMYHI